MVQSSYSNDEGTDLSNRLHEHDCHLAKTCLKKGSTTGIIITTELLAWATLRMHDERECESIESSIYRYVSSDCDECHGVWIHRLIDSFVSRLASTSFQSIVRNVEWGVEWHSSVATGINFMVEFGMRISHFQVADERKDKIEHQSESSPISMRHSSWSHL